MAKQTRSDLWRALRGDDPFGTLTAWICQRGGKLNPQQHHEIDELEPCLDSARPTTPRSSNRHAHEGSSATILGIVCDALQHNDAVLAEALQIVFEADISDCQIFQADSVAGMCYPLVCASLNGCSSAVAVLLLHDINPDQADHHGRTALLRAAERGHAQVVTVLLEHGADSSATSKAGSWTALHLAADAGFEAVVDTLVGHGANTESQTDSGCTPLLCAAVNGQPGVTALLIQAGAQVEEADRHGYTPLLRAAEHGHTAVARVLLDAGANVNAIDNLKCTALIWASWGGHLEVSALLLARGAATANENNHRLTALMSAAGRGYDAVVLCLLVLSRSGIDPADHKASLAAAVSFEHPAVAMLLETERLPSWAGKRLRLAAAGRAPHFASIVLTLLRSGLDNPELYPRGLLSETARNPPAWSDSAATTVHADARAQPEHGTMHAPTLLPLMERLMRASGSGWSASAHYLYPTAIRRQIWTVMLVQQRFNLIVGGSFDASEGQVVLWLPWELWVYGILLFVRR